MDGSLMQGWRVGKVESVEIGTALGAVAQYGMTWRQEY